MIKNKLNDILLKKISSYRSEFITINNKLCLIADEPKRYDIEI